MDCNAGWLRDSAEISLERLTRIVSKSTFDRLIFHTSGIIRGCKDQDLKSTRGNFIFRGGLRCIVFSRWQFSNSNSTNSNSTPVVLRISRAKSLRTIDPSFPSLRYSFPTLKFFSSRFFLASLFLFTDRIPFMVFSNCFVSLSFLLAIHFLSQNSTKNVSFFDRRNLH